jgi:hypothetical protein
MKKKLKLNVGFRGHVAGSIIDIDINDEGVPSDGFWRRRIKDAEVDNCVEFVCAGKDSEQVLYEEEF